MNAEPSTDGVAVVDESGVIQSVNERMCALTGRKSEQLIGRSIQELIASSFGGSHLAIDRLATATGRPAGERMELHARQPDGSEFPVEVCICPISIESRPVAVAVVRDVSRRRRLEQDLQQALSTAEAEREAFRTVMNRFETALAHAPIIVSTTDEQLRYTWIYNPDPHWRPEEIIGKRDDELSPPEHVKDLIALKRQALESKQRVHAELSMTVVHETRTYDLTIDPIVDSGGHARGVRVAAMDVTNLKRTEEQLRLALAVKDEFLALVSHDLRSPLTTIIGNAFILRRRDNIPEDDRVRALSHIEEAARRLDVTIQELIELARLQGSTEDISPEPVPLAQVVADSVSDFATAHADAEIDLAVRDADLSVRGREEYVRRILNNLLTNAEKYSPEATRIEVSIRKSGSFAEVQVADRGKGVQQEEIARLFEPFYRSEASRTAAPSGIGVGLTLCQRLVEAQGGSIWAAPRPGGGSIFAFTLPLWLQQPSATRDAV